MLVPELDPIQENPLRIVWQISDDASLGTKAYLQMICIARAIHPDRIAAARKLCR